MTDLGEVNNRKILYIRHELGSAWYNDFPKSNWLLLAISDTRRAAVFEEIARQAINSNVVCVCAVGQEAEFFYDSFEDTMLMREVELEFLPAHTISTTWQENLEECFLFAVNSAISEQVVVEKIICLDISQSGVKEKLIKLVEENQSS